LKESSDLETLIAVGSRFVEQQRRKHDFQSRFLSYRNMREGLARVQFSSAVMSCSKLPLLMLISSMSHELVEADLEERSTNI